MTSAQRFWRPDPRVALLAALVIIAAGFALVLLAYWPGVMIDDARWQYQQAVDNAFEDWHPPIMAWVWRQLMLLVAPGPGPMLILQLLFYWAGFALLAGWAWRRGRPRLALALACCGWIPAPLALSGSVIKDVWMAGCLVCAVGLILWRDAAARRLTRTALTVAVALTLLLAAALRLNAIFACLPLALAAAPRAFTRTWPRWIATAILACLPLLAIGPAINAAVQADNSDVQLSLIIFDLGGITEHSGVSVFPDMNVKDAVAVNHRCYDPSEWDSYSDWAQRPCPLGFDRMQPMVDDEDFDPRAVWFHAIVAHPLAYAAHRLAHFNLETWFVVPRGPSFTAGTQSVDNPWGFRVPRNALLSTIHAVANAAAGTPLGWPFFWISLALAAWTVAHATRMDAAVQAVAASAFLYGAGFAAVGVATGIRYYVWTISGAAIATVLVAARITMGEARPRRSVTALASAIVLVPLAIGITARLAT